MMFNIKKYDMWRIRDEIFFKVGGTYPKPYCRSVPSQEHIELMMFGCMTSCDFPVGMRFAIIGSFLL